MGDSFNDKTILRMRVIEEANLHGISIKTVRSNNYTLKVKGYQFFVLASYSKRKGWIIKHAMDNAEAEGDDESAACRTPFTSKWLVPIIISAVENTRPIKWRHLQYSCSIRKTICIDVCNLTGDKEACMQRFIW